MTLNFFLMMIFWLNTVVRYLVCILYFFSSSVSNVNCLLCCFAVAGAPLRALIKKSPRMISESLMALLAQRGATSLAAKAPESTGEKGDEETSRPSNLISKVVDVEPDASADPPQKEIVELSPDKERKRLRDDGDGSSRSCHKKSKSSSRSKGADVNKPPKIPVTGSFSQAVAHAKDHLDKVCVSCCRYYSCLFSYSILFLLLVLILCAPPFQLVADFATLVSLTPRVDEAAISRLQSEVDALKEQKSLVDD